MSHKFIKKFSEIFWNKQIDYHYETIQDIKTHAEIYKDIEKFGCAIGFHKLNPRFAFVEQFLMLDLPLIGPFFWGIEHSPIIENVSFIFSNHSSEFEIPCEKIDNVWVTSIMPIPLFYKFEHEVLHETPNQKSHIVVKIQIKSNTLIKATTIIRGVFGHVSKEILADLKNNMKYVIPLITSSDGHSSQALKVILDLWDITTN